PKKNQQDLHLPGGKLGIKIKLADHFDLKGNVGRSYRVPSFAELFGDRGLFIGNPNLRPESGINFDAGTIFHTESLQMELTYYQNELDDLIQLLQTSQYTIQAENLGKARIQGIEVATQWRPTKPLSLALNYTYQKARDQSGLPATDGLLLPGRPVHELDAKVNYRYQALRFFTDINFIDSNFLDTQNIRAVNHRTFWNVGSQVSFFKYFAASFEVKNILDDQTVDIVGFPLPGRGYFGKLEMRN
ncbi:MAG: TonB-dependent receptor, partial [Deltaproteobacteria bacterium]|nr:TonB-dependent receptor [Deltaproteobacteria bacterium]